MSKSYSNKALPAGTVLREWRLEEVLGVGGFAITYEAKDLTLDLPVAVKEYFPAIWARRAGDGTVHPASESAAKEFESAKALFSREAQLLARFKHKNIVSVYRVVPANGTAYAWGYNQYGQLGDGTTTDRNFPTNVHGL